MLILFDVSKIIGVDNFLFQMQILRYQMWYTHVYEEEDMIFNPYKITKQNIIKKKN